jgi:tetratricopeptide (TPR) repeat protein
MMMKTERTTKRSVVSKKIQPKIHWISSLSQCVSSNIMTTLKFTIFFSIIALYSCGQTTTKHKVNPELVRLNKEIIPFFSFTNNPDSCRKALLILDSATTIDSNDFNAYYNKLFFLYGLKQYDKAINTANELIKLSPNAHDLYILKGNLLNKMGDTTSANINFEKSLKICNSVLDTMHETNADYLMLVTGKAVNLIMLGDSAKANKILKVLYDKQPDDPAYDNFEKKLILSLMNKNRIQLIDFLNKPDTTRSNSTAYPQ